MKTKKHQVVEWDLKFVKDWINTCISHGGLPSFRTRAYGREITYEGERAVYGVCFLASDVPTLIIKKVPTDIIKLMEENTGEWRVIRNMGNT